MHYSKRFIAFGGIVAIAFLIKYNIPGAEYEQIGSFRGASLEAETWNPLIASSVNDNLLSVIIDNKQYTNEKYKFRHYDAGFHFAGCLKLQRTYL